MNSDTDQRGAGPAAGKAPDSRLADLRRLLQESGFPEVQASIAGSRQEIAALRSPPERVAELAEIANTIKSIGFLYVALEITPAQETE